jgi:UDP-N-acetylmuramoyl-tripeptide--D-alanyl-D-alanine ligase
MEAHLEGFGSVADVADIKAEIYDALDADGVAILNLDQPWAELWRERISQRREDGCLFPAWTARRMSAREVLRPGPGAARTSRCASAGESRAADCPCPGATTSPMPWPPRPWPSPAGLGIDSIVPGYCQLQA